MEKNIFAIEAYTLFDDLHTLEGIEKVFNVLARIGFNALEVSAIDPIYHEDVRRLSKQYNIKICSAQNGFKNLTGKGLEGLIRKHQILEAEYVVIGDMPEKYHGSIDGYKEFASVLSEAANKLKKYGFKLAYHNYLRDLHIMGGRTGFDILIDEFDKDLVKFEIDTGMIMACGVNPLEYINKVGSRLDLIHLKDFGVDEKGVYHSVDFGNGNTNWDEIIPACQKFGVKNYIIENEYHTYRGDAVKGIEISLNNLKRYF